jgi:Na+-driven multidrug efflux pump
MVWWGVVSGVVLGAATLAGRDIVAPLFSGDEAVRSMVASVLVVVALHQPIAGVVFVLDGVLIGAGDGRYLARAGVITLLAFAPLALTVMWAGASLVWLWWAFVGFMTARLLTLLWRAAGDRWMVLGAAVREAEAAGPVRTRPRRRG